MAKKQQFGSVHDLLTYNSTTGHIYNQIVIGGRGKKRVDCIEASYLSATFADDPSVLRSSRIVVFEGQFSDNQPFIDLGVDLDAQNLGIKVLMDVYTAAGSHRIITPNNLGILVEDDKVVSIVQWPIYKSGDSNGAPSPAFATLSVQGVTFYDTKGDNDIKYTFR